MYGEFAWYNSRVVHLVTHPVAQDALARLRDTHTPSDAFRRLARRAALILAADALRDLPLQETVVDTPVARAACRHLATDVVLVPVLRAGLALVDPLLELLPDARVGHIGLQRDEATAAASRYYARVPQGLAESLVLLLDPMLATGGSALAALDVLHEAGARDIRLLCLVAAPEGIAAVESRYPQVRIFTPAVDRELNARKFIVPGLGDFGDRLYGTV